MLKKRWILNLALALFVAALALLVKYQPGAPGKVDELPPLTDLGAEAITSIRIERPGQEPIALQREGQDWQLRAPLPARADRFRVDGLLHLAGAKSLQRFVANPNDLGKYGLDKPLATVWLNDTSLKFGAPHAFNNQQYVLYKDEIHLIAAGSFRPVLTPLAQFFSTSIIDDNLKPAAFKLPGFELALQDGAWRIKPANKNLSSDRISRFADEWRYARALKVERSSGKRSQARVRISFASEPGIKTARPLDIAVLSRQPELVLYRKDEGLEYYFPQEMGERLLALTPD